MGKYLDSQCHMLQDAIVCFELIGWQTQCQVKRCRIAGYRNTRPIELSFKIRFKILGLIFESTLGRFSHPKLHPVCDICFPGDSGNWNNCMLRGIAVRVVIHAETFVRMRVAIDTWFFRYFLTMIGDFSILMNLQDLYHEISHLKLI